MSSPGVGPASQRLGRYHLAEPLGGGPTGEVFRAKVYGVAGFERQFAVKRFHAEFVRDPATAETVASAARVYGSLEHPRIARLYEYGVTGGHTFTATELVQGMDLARLLGLLAAQGSTLPEGATAALLSQIARTVGYAHGRGICHLGLCPTNILVTASGEARITDFGFLPPRLPASPADDPSLRARLPYLAPEQLASESTSAATDVFQLGAIGFEMFMLEQAFSGRDSATIAQRITRAEHTPLVLAKPLAKVVEQCLKRSPFERFPDARAFADALDAATRDLGLPGTLIDVGQAVRTAAERQENLSADEMSGALSFPLPAPPRADSALPTMVAAAPGEAPGEAPGARPSSQLGDDLPATTLRDPSQGLGPGRGPSSGPSRGPSARPDSGAPKGRPRPPVPPGFKGRKPGAPRSSPTVQAPSSLGSRMPLAKSAMAGAAEELDEDMPTRIRERHKGFIQPTPMGLATVDAPASLRPDDAPGASNAPSAGAQSDADAPDSSASAASRAASKRAGREADSLLGVDDPGDGTAAAEPSPHAPPHASPDASPDAWIVASPDESTDASADEHAGVEPDSAAAADSPVADEPRVNTPPPLPFADLSVDAIEISAAELELLPAGASDPGRPLPESTPPPPPGATDPAKAEPAARPPLVGRKRPGGLPMTISDASPDIEPAVRASNTWDAIAAIPHGNVQSRDESQSDAPPFPSLVREPKSPGTGTGTGAGRTKRAKTGGSMVGRLVIGAFVLALLGGGGYFAYSKFFAGKSDDGERVALTQIDAAPVRPSTDLDAGRTIPAVNSKDAGSAPMDAGSKPPADAGSEVVAKAVDAAVRRPDPIPPDQAPPDQTPTDDGRLTIRSRPSRAKAYLDGSPLGTTTVRMAATKDRHRLVIIRPGYKMYAAEIDGAGKVKVRLEEASSLDGPAGIKVRCARKNRYYVFVDGLHTGQLCPTERLGVALGDHTVEIYDPVTETRRQFPVTVENTRRSLRVRVD